MSQPAFLSVGCDVQERHPHGPDLTHAPARVSGSDRRCFAAFRQKKNKNSSDKVNAEIVFTNCPNTTFEGFAYISTVYILNEYFYFHFFPA